MTCEPKELTDNTLVIKWTIQKNAVITVHEQYIRFENLYTKSFLELCFKQCYKRLKEALEQEKDCYE